MESNRDGVKTRNQNRNYVNERQAPGNPKIKDVSIRKWKMLIQSVIYTEQESYYISRELNLTFSLCLKR